MTHVAGTEGIFTLDLSPRWRGLEPWDGMLLKSGPSGACWEVLSWRPVDARSIEPGWRRFRLRVMRLGYDAIPEGGEDLLTFPLERRRPALR